jgi:type IV pilus assembly protein PilN
MIKVNLLRDQTARARKTFAKSNVSRTGLIFLAIFLVAAGTLGTWTFYVNRQIAAGIEKRTELRKAEARLQLLKLEIVKFERLKQLRQSRIDVIEKLKEGQSGPVLLLNTLIQSIPRDGDLWLTSLTQKSGIITIVGQTRIPEVIPDLMRNLTASGIFASVDLELIERQEDSSKFTLICTSIKKPQAE